MFSTSMIASSTTSPSAITSPASTIVLIVAAAQVQHQRRGQQRQRDRRQADQRRPPVEQERDQDDDHQHAADEHARAQVAQRPLDERGRAEDGRVDLHARQARPQRLQRRLDLAGHLQRVAPGLLLDDQQQARAVVDDRVADRRRDGRPPRRPRRPAAAGAPPRKATGRGPGPPASRRPRPGAAPAAAGWACRRSRPPPARSRRRRPVTTASSVTPCAAQPLGIDQHLELPVALAPDGDVGHAGDRHQPRPDRPARQDRQVHLASVFDDMPIFSTRLVDDSGGRITGGRATAGSCARLRRQPLLHELPGLASGRCPARRSAPPTTAPAPTWSASSCSQDVPLSAFSSGTVTRLSTSSVDRPGASVWISTSGGANSGNTSSGVAAHQLPAARQQQHGQAEHQHAQPQRRRPARPSFAGPELGAEQLRGAHRDDRAPAAGPRASTARPRRRCPARVTSTRRRLYTRGAVRSYTHAPPWMSYTTADQGTTSALLAARRAAAPPAPAGRDGTRRRGCPAVEEIGAGGLGLRPRGAPPPAGPGARPRRAPPSGRTRAGRPIHGADFAHVNRHPHPDGVGRVHLEQRRSRADRLARADHHLAQHAGLGRLDGQRAPAGAARPPRTAAGWPRPAPARPGLLRRGAGWRRRPHSRSARCGLLSGDVEPHPGPGQLGRGWQRGQPQHRSGRAGPAPRRQHLRQHGARHRGRHQDGAAARHNHLPGEGTHPVTVRRSTVPTCTPSRCSAFGLRVTVAAPTPWAGWSPWRAGACGQPPAPSTGRPRASGKHTTSDASARIDQLPSYTAIQLGRRPPQVRLQLGVAQPGIDHLPRGLQHEQLRGLALGERLLGLAHGLTDGGSTRARSAVSDCGASWYCRRAVRTSSDDLLAGRPRSCQIARSTSARARAMPPRFWLNSGSSRLKPGPVSSPSRPAPLRSKIAAAWLNTATSPSPPGPPPPRWPARPPADRAARPAPASATDPAPTRAGARVPAHLQRGHLDRPAPAPGASNLAVCFCSVKRRQSSAAVSTSTWAPPLRPD